MAIIGSHKNFLSAKLITLLFVAAPLNGNRKLIELKEEEKKAMKLAAKEDFKSFQELSKHNLCHEKPNSKMPVNWMWVS